MRMTASGGGEAVTLRRRDRRRKRQRLKTSPQRTGLSHITGFASSSPSSSRRKPLSSLSRTLQREREPAPRSGGGRVRVFKSGAWISLTLPIASAMGPLPLPLRSAGEGTLASARKGLAEELEARLPMALGRRLVIDG